jgi:large subunit ribosomal protein L9
MEIILRQAIENLGHPGDVVTVKNGYARNYLLPRGFAYEATPGNLKRIGAERSRLEAAENDRRGSAAELAKKLEEVQITFSARVGERVPVKLHADVKPEIRVWVIKA